LNALVDRSFSNLGAEAIGLLQLCSFLQNFTVTLKLLIYWMK